jgi:hypothetical protein
VLREDRLRRRTGERRLAGQHFIHHAAERVDVASRVNRASRRLLGAHVQHGTERETGAGERVRGRAVAHDLRDSKVCDDGRAAADEDVLRLDVAVDDALRVRIVEREADVTGDLQGLVERELALLIEPIAERGALQHRHHVVQDLRAVRRAG